MTQINIKRLVDNISKTNIYTPIVEAIANSIDSIEESGRTDGKILIKLIRSKQESLLETNEAHPIVGIKVVDNGIGFTTKNLESFNTIYTEQKIRKGGKGFGRFVYLKYFQEINVESNFREKGVYSKRLFSFVKDNNIIQDEKIIQLDEKKDPETVLFLNNLKKEHYNKLNKKIDTIARKLLEKLLVYFVLDDYKCPEIAVEEEDSKERIILNNYLGSDNEIKQLVDTNFILKSNEADSSEKFKAKIFKIFYGESRSSINLVADNRQVTEEVLHTYIPEFKDDFYDIEINEKGEKVNKNYTIKIYVLGRYLDENVSLERDGFEFQNKAELFFPFSQIQIEKEAAETAKRHFKEEVKTRQEKKEKEVREYVDKEAPWHKFYFKELDLSLIPYGISKQDLENELNKIRFQKELTTRTEINKIIAGNNETDISKKADDLVKRITEIGKSQLTHYVCLRKSILDLFKKSLTWGEDKKFEKEKVIHDIIFPTTQDSDNLPYEKHNLWIVDEKLSFTEFLASDKPLNLHDERPDLLIFDHKISLRGGEEPSNPIIVFEFKRPQRTNYKNNENPLKQIADYISKIRKGEVKNPEGRKIYVTDNTPAYGFLICDITNEIETFCLDFSLTKSPDNKGYFGFHSNYKIYYEVISFDKLVEDADLRNKIFFKHLGM